MGGLRIHLDPALLVQATLRAEADLPIELKPGLQLMGDGRYAEAAIAFDEVSVASPDLPWSTVLAAQCYLAAGNNDDAMHLLQIAVHQEPTNFLAWYCLGIAWRNEGDQGQALRCFETASRQGEQVASARLMQGATLADLGRYAEARATFEQLLNDHPHDPEVNLQLGLALLKGFGQAEAALAIFQRVAAEGGESGFAALLNEAFALRCLGRLDEAIALYDRLVVQRGTAYVKWQRGLALLYSHQYEQAWADYEYRTVLSGSRQLIPTCPVWSPPAQPGETVLVLSEQGLGDQILFATCVPELVRLADLEKARCVVECNPRLKSLFSRSFPSVTVVGRSDAKLPEGITFAPKNPVRQILAGSLPFHFRKRVEDFPVASKLLRADPDKVRRWSKSLQLLGAGRKVGIAWRGGTPKTNAALRTVPLVHWLPVFAVPDCQFVSLQHGDCASELSALKAEGHDLTSWAGALQDIDETAALIEALDVVVSVTATVVHLAGALGKRCFVLTPFQPEWAFAGSTNRMHWYPSVTLIRQRSLDDWSDTMQCAAEALST